MNEFFALIDQTKLLEAVALSYHFVNNWMPPKYERSQKESDARPLTQILNSIEVLTLYASSCLNETLIKLSENLEQPALKRKVEELLCTIFVGFKSLMKSRNKRVENSLKYSLKYSSEQFSDVLESLNLSYEFDK